MTREHPPLDATEAIAWMNERYATVVNGGQMFVVSRRLDPVLDRYVIDYTSCDHFKNNFFMGDRVGVPDVDGLIKKTRPFAQYWLLHPNRRHYPGGMIFDPTEQSSKTEYFNLWTGFAAIALQQQIDTPDATWAWLKNHIKFNITQENREHYEYVLDWMAMGVQYPDRPAGTALVLRGNEGIGKGIFARAYGKLFGSHWLHLNDARQLTGTFNAHLEDSIVVFADEAIGTSDKAAVSKLKTLITEPTIQIEAKYRPAHTAANHIRVILASNESWVVPAGKDARRYCVLDVGNEQQGVRDYFKLITDELDAGGYGAMLTELATRDLADFDITDIPRTAALLDQKLHTLPADEEWWLDRLKEGRLLPFHEHWQETISRREVREAYQGAMKIVARDRRETIRAATNLQILLSRMLPDGYPRDGGLVLSDRTWVIPDLFDCRQHFESLIGHSLVWDV